MRLIANPGSADRAALESPTFRTNNFDLIRLFAAFQVAILHMFHRYGLPIPQALEPLAWFPGVPIFFIVSGFLISASLDRADNLVDYARSRALRIFPGLWGVLTATAIVVLLAGFAGNGTDFILWFATQLVGLIYTPDFLRGFGDGSYNGSLWTIPVELQFYVMLPILYMLASRFRIGLTPLLVGAFLIFVIIGGGLKLIFPEMGVDDGGSIAKLIRYTFVPRFYMFLFGVLLQRFRVYQSPLVRGRGLYWLAGYALFNAFMPTDGLYYMAGEMMLGLTAISLAYSLPTLSRRLLGGTDISYGVYLYHGLVINIIFVLAAPRTFSTMIFSLMISALAGLLSWFLIERPVLRNRRQRMWPMSVVRTVGADCGLK